MYRCYTLKLSKSLHPFAVFPANPLFSPRSLLDNHTVYGRHPAIATAHDAFTQSTLSSMASVNIGYCSMDSTADVNIPNPTRVP